MRPYARGTHTFYLPQCCPWPSELHVHKCARAYVCVCVHVKGLKALVFWYLPLSQILAFSKRMSVDVSFLPKRGPTPLLLMPEAYLASSSVLLLLLLPPTLPVLPYLSLATRSA